MEAKVSEQWYDTQIAPELMKLAKRCKDRGVSFLAVVEYAEGERGTIAFMNKDPSLEMVMIRHCAQTAPNIDAYVINVGRYAKECGIDTGASIVMRRMTPNSQAQRSREAASAVADCSEGANGGSA